MMTDHDLLCALRAMDLKPRRVNGQWQARCPVHDDRSPSLSARVTPEGKLLAYCHAGCDFKLIVHALGVSNPAVKANRDPVIDEPPRPDPSMLREWRSIRERAVSADVTERERKLGIPPGGLIRMGAAWSLAMMALTAPMFDRPAGQVIGVRVRADDGRKWAITGSHNGLFLPTTFLDSGPLYAPEGLTDSAALAGLGFDVLGRPACNGGRVLVRAAAKISGRAVVVVSDRDAPGVAGAHQLASELKRDGVRVRVITPPGAKDIREWVADGAGRGDVEWLVKNGSDL